jgi:hypothetical protein
MGAWQRTIEAEMAGNEEEDGPVMRYVKNILRTVNVFKTGSEIIGGASEAMEKTLVAAEGLGFALQTIQNLTNAEAVLEDERRNGLITFDQYLVRQQKLNDLQTQSSDYIGKIFSAGADSGAVMQALEDQLSFQGFDEDQIKRISDRFSPDALTKQIFGEDKDFSSLDKEQKEYVEEVFTRVMSGLTPENISQRLNDVEGTYSSMAERYIDAVNSGFEGGMDAWFQRENIAEFISERMGGGIQGTRTRGGGYISPEQLAKNVADSDMDLKALENGGTDSMEVFVALTKFLNQDFAKEIMSSKDRILDFGQALATLRDYEKINIELFIQDPEFDENKLKDQLDLMKNIKFDEKTFGENAKKIGKALGTNLIDPQEFANALAKSGIPLDQFFAKYVDSAKKVGEAIMDLPAKAFDEMGRLKPEVLVSILPSLLGVSVSDAAQIGATLNGAFPESLSPIQLQILVSLGGEGAALLSRMQGDPAFKDAVLKGTPGEDVVIKGYSGPGTSFNVPDQVVSAAQADLARLFFSADTGGFKAPPVKEKPKGSSGSGGGDKKDPLKDFMDSIMDQANKFTNLAKLLNGKYKNAKNALKKALSDPNFGFAGSFADKMRKAGLSEKLIADILSKGVEEATIIWSNFSKTTKKGKTVLTEAGKQAMALSAASDIGQAINALQTQIATDRAKIGFKERLKSEGMEAKEIEEVLSSTDGALILQLMSVDKNSKHWKQWIKNQKDAKKASEDLEEPLSESAKALEAQSETMDYVNKNFAKQIAEFEFQAYLDFAAAHGKTVEEMQREISANERLIDGHKDRIGLIQKEIQALERRRDTTGDIGKMGLEQLQREVELNNQAIRSLERRNELDQRRIDTLNRQDQIRNRVADALGYELELMSQQESKINEAYDERFKALDKVSKINDHLINQQRQQLGLSQAIAEGDIYAATAAAQEMRASSAQFARDQMRTGLETARENQIEGLRTEGGLSRDQAEERIAAIKEQSYQTSLMIRDIEDAIYERNLNEILPLKDKQFNLESAIQGINNQIFEKQQQILQIERDKIEPLEETNSKLDRALKYHNDMKDEAIEQMRVNGLTQAEWDKLNSKVVAGLEYAELMTDDTLAARNAAGLLADQWQNVAAQVNSAYKAMRDEYTKVDTLKIKEGETQKDFDARREAARNAARNAYNERLAGIMSGAPALFTGALSGTSSPTESKKQPSNAARGLTMPGGRLTIGEAFDQGIVYLGGNGRLRWSSNRQLVKGVDGSDLSKYAMGGKVKGYGKGGKMLRYPMGGLIPYSLGGSVSGEGSRDSVLAKLTPGEFVIRKAMVGKYGIPMLEALNQGAFNLPKYNVGSEDPISVKTSTNNASINAPVYNTYDMKFAVSGTNASADEIANKVMFKMKQVQGQGIRSNRGY